MRSAETVLGIIHDRGSRVDRGLGRHWRAGCSERRTPGSGRGGWKSAGIGNSLAAYSTWW
jgi:hypothetical protein